MKLKTNNVEEICKVLQGVTRSQGLVTTERELLEGMSTWYTKWFKDLSNRDGLSVAVERSFIQHEGQFYAYLMGLVISSDSSTRAFRINSFLIYPK